MVGWLAPSPRTGLVLDDMQVVSVKVAVALCADAAFTPGDLGEMAEERVPMGPGMNALCGRLRMLGMPGQYSKPGTPADAGLRLAARDGERVDARQPSQWSGNAGRSRAGRPGPGRVVVRLSEAERGLLRAACERLLGLLDGRVLGLADGRARAVRAAVEAVLADLREAGTAVAPAPAGGAAAAGAATARSARALTPSSIFRSVRNSTGSVSSPLLIRLHGAAE